MGLVLRGLGGAADPEVTVDPYVPLTVQWPKYLSVMDRPESVVLSGREAIIEVKTAPADGEVLEFILVDAAAVHSSRSASMTLPSFTPGVPLLSYTNEVEEFEPSVHLYSNGIKVRFDSSTPSSNIGGDRATFGFSEVGRLICLDVLLSESEVEAISP